MPKRLTVPMTRASGFGPLPQLLVEWESEHALNKAFQTQALSLAVTEQPNTFVLIAAMRGVFEHAARAAGRRDFGLSVGEAMSVASFGLWLQYSASARNLGEGLYRTVATVRFQQSAGGLAVEREDGFTVWRYHPPPLDEAHTQHSDHLLYPMLRFVRSFLGHGWNPAWIELNYPRDSEAASIEARLPAPVRFAQKSVGLAMRPAVLSNPGPLRPARPITLLDVEANEGLPHFDEPLRSIVSIAMLRLMDGKTDIKGTAAMTGMSVRTLQRVLNTEGLSYRGLLGLVRTQRATALLRETDLTVTQVALTLGYSEHANFTRAFNRWLGCSPVHYRARACQGAQAQEA